MARRIRRKALKAGMAPGSLVYLGDRKTEAVRIHVMEYGPGGLDERDVSDVAECGQRRERDTIISWINVDGLHEVSVVETLGQSYGLHPLVLEDLVAVDQRPKMESYDDYIFFVLRMLTWNESTSRLEEEQIGLVLGPGWVLSFQERPGDVLEPVRDRLRAGKGRIRHRGADYLTYALIDSVVDHYFVVLERLGERIDELEAELIDQPKPEVVREIYRLKRELLHLRKSVWPLREVLSGLLRDEDRLIGRETRIFLRDVYDHTIHVIDTVETYRDIAAGMLDTYLTSVNNRMSEVMKVLTIIATIFIPLTFIAGVYGMNFEHMPELPQPWAYPAVLAVMAAVALAMVYYFRRRGWF